MNTKFFKNIEVAKALGLKEEVLYVENQVVSKTLTQTNNVSITLFAFDKGEEISTHSAPGDALVYVTEGQVTITIGNNDPVIVNEGEIILMSANTPHGLVANERFKMMLVIVNG
ncbi:cupin domain-containing protein [Clostridium estertheticum]|uniref:cupin domain-containing protein n=1 Tax=Clostridium estertheticum TaxID=238834 RepID=UPI001C0DDEEF|nr:cupin domain-containing protein [Clostridium estertheticum]MBU3184855.1 cupin domain-containing protein [Clostridium estertheticum]